MPRNKVFISYSRAEKQYLDELLPALRAVRSIGDVLWFDEGEIDTGDKFHDKIQGALAESGVAILLLSKHFLTSPYITQHELPYLLKQAEQQALSLGFLYVTAIADAAFNVTIEVDGRQQIVDLKKYLGAHDVNEPLETLDKGVQNKIYAKLADWVTQRLIVRPVPPPRRLNPLPRRPGQRFELAIMLRARRSHWEHSFSLPHAADFDRPTLDCPTPEELFRYTSNTVDGEDLFHLLFGRDEPKSSEILGAAFEEGAAADPTRHPLRVRLRTNDERLCALPWASITYKGRRLVVDGWTVELHADSIVGFPEYPPHTCYFPGKVVLIRACNQVQTPQGIAHFHDLQHFFQRRWQKPSTGDFARLARAVEFSGSKAVGQVSSLLRVHRVQGEVKVYGGPERKPPDANGIEWVNVCPGTFTMGTIVGEDEMADKSEIVYPPRTVVFSAFQIAATETTQQQYGRIYPDYGKDADVPVVDVNWEQAQAFCQHLQIGGALPTEAQWEYAARSGSRFPWSFGDDAARLEQYAWFGENISGQAHEVKKKLPNPLGLYDMHGNVWEWVRDWYGDHQSGLFIDPLGRGSGKCPEWYISALGRGDSVLCVPGRRRPRALGQDQRVPVRTRPALALTR